MSTRSIYLLDHRRRRTTAGLFTVRSLFAAIVALLIYSALNGNARAAANSANEEPTAASPAFHSLADIRAAAEAHVRDAAIVQAGAATGDIVATARELDSRLRFARCDSPLKTFALNNAALSARTTIGVRCAQGMEWTVYLPVDVATDMNVLVLRRIATRTTQLTAADVEVQRRRVAGLAANYVSDVSLLAGQRLKRTVAAGAVLATDMMQRDAVVRRGQQVVLVASVGGIDVRASGIALSDGGNTDRIRVQNQSSLKVVEGTVEAANLVRVGM